MKKCEVKETRCSMPQKICCFVPKENNNCKMILILFILLAIIAGGVSNY